MKLPSFRNPRVCGLPANRRAARIAFLTIYKSYRFFCAVKLQVLKERVFVYVLHHNMPRNDRTPSPAGEDELYEVEKIKDHRVRIVGMFVALH
jgi:hypothetical protein